MVRVRYRANELGDGGVVEVLEADSFRIMEDHTVKLLAWDEDKDKFVLIGYIHAHRWESIIQMEDANDGDDF